MAALRSSCQLRGFHIPLHKPLDKIVADEPGVAGDDDLVHSWHSRTIVGALRGLQVSVRGSHVAT